MRLKMLCYTTKTKFNITIMKVCEYFEACL